VHSKAGLGGASNFDFKFQPKLPGSARNEALEAGSPRVSKIRIWQRPVESVLIVIFLALSTMGLLLCVGVWKLARAILAQGVGL
jgi:hypothetical protein